MAIAMPPLPYSQKALEPWISEQTLQYHYGKHHKGYVDKTNKQIEGTKLDKANLKEIVLNTSSSLYNLSAQAWNHEFYWKGLYAADQKQISASLKKQIEQDFNSIEEFQSQFTKEALSHFGSGWTWLIRDNEKLKITSTHDAHTPLKDGHTPLLTCDVWEHAYYIDYRNDRGKYLEGFWKIVNWEFVDQNCFS